MTINTLKCDSEGVPLLIQHYEIYPTYSQEYVEHVYVKLFNGRERVIKVYKERLFPIYVLKYRKKNIPLLLSYINDYIIDNFKTKFTGQL